jgi:D-alanine--poly(phosphoribitol) ligase subunit 2
VDKVATADIAARIIDQLIAISGAEEIRGNLDLPLYEREVMDSMKTVEMIVAIEETIGLHVSPADLDRQMWATPRKIVIDIQRRLEA